MNETKITREVDKAEGECVIITQSVQSFFRIELITKNESDV